MCSSDLYSPLRKVNIEKVVQFMISHLDFADSKTPPENRPGHDDLALGIAQIALDNLEKNSEMSKSLCKVLNSTRITGDNETITSKLTRLLELLLEDISDKPLIRTLNGILNSLGKVITRKRGRKGEDKQPAAKRRRTESPVIERAAETKKRKRALSVKIVESPLKKAKPAPLPKTAKRPADTESNTDGDPDSPQPQDSAAAETSTISEASESVVGKKTVISFSGFSDRKSVV